MLWNNFTEHDVRFEATDCVKRKEKFQNMLQGPTEVKAQLCFVQLGPYFSMFLLQVTDRGKKLKLVQYWVRPLQPAATQHAAM